MAGEKIVMGTGVVYFADAGNLDVKAKGDALLPYDGQTPTAAMVSTEPTITAGWTQVAELGKEGFVFAPGQQVQLIAQANSLWPIDARQIGNAGAFTLTLLNADIETIYNFGLGRVGVDRQTGNNATADAVDALYFPHDGGPENSIPGISILFDGFGATFDKAGTTRQRRRIWIPRAIQTAPLALAQSDLQPTTIVGQFTIALSDKVKTVSTIDYSLPAAWMADFLVDQS